ncbi:MAG: hypothetical protein ACTSUY_06410 [Alphaproteobacteria bacterium]
MTTVFLSGSRKISRLNDMIRNRILNMVGQDFQIVVGDANGADKALQNFLADIQYQNVVVYCAGRTCRNNVGNWETQHIEVDSKLKGRKFYTQKDKRMAAKADFGFVLWDGKSAGSINNVFELLKREKAVVVYLSPRKEFTNVSKPQDIENLLENCDIADYQKLYKKINLNRHLKELHHSRQETLIL